MRAGRFPLIAGASVGFVVWLCGAASAGQEGGADFREAVRAAQRSVVMVETGLRHPLTGEGTVYTMNTGVMVTDEGHVLTSLVAVSGATQVRVFPPGHEPMDTELWALDQVCGLALLKMDIQGATPVELADRASEPGEWIVVARAAYMPDQGVGSSILPAVLSSSTAHVRFAGTEWGGLMQFDLGSCVSCASSPVLNREGKLAGIVMTGRPWRSGGECYYALAAADLRPILSDLIAKRVRRLGWVGLAVAHAEGREGLTVEGVLEGSPAYMAGIRPGEVLLDIDDTVIDSPSVFASKVARSAPSSRLTVTVLQQGGDVRTVVVEVGARPLLISGMPTRVVPGLPGEPRGMSEQDELEGQDVEMVLQRLIRENKALAEKVRRLERTEAGGPSSPDPQDGRPEHP